jgi:hypothetical protein
MGANEARPTGHQDLVVCVGSLKGHCRFQRPLFDHYSTATLRAEWYRQ